MTYRDAKKVKPGGQVMLLQKERRYAITTVLSITNSDEAREIVFHCTDGDFRHDKVSPVIPIEAQAERFLMSSSTRVFINHNDELGEWLYSVEVVDSDGFWLGSWPTKEEAERYITDNNLKMV